MLLKSKYPALVCYAVFIVTFFADESISEDVLVETPTGVLQGQVRVGGIT